MEVIANVAQLEAIEDAPSLAKDTLRPPISLGTFYLEETEGESKSYLVRKVGDKILRRIITFSGLEDSPNISYLRDEITEDQLKQEFVCLKIYQELGLDVSEAQLGIIDGKAALVVEDLGIVRRVDPTSTTLDKAHKDEVKRLYIASHMLNNPYFVFSLSEDTGGRVILTDALPQSKDREPGIFFSPANPLLRNYRNSEKFEKAFGLEINPQGEIEQNFRQQVERLSSQRIAEIALEAGITPDEARSLLGKLLGGKEATLERLTFHNPEDALNNSPEWDKLDEILEKSEGNRPFRVLSEIAQRAIETIEEVGRNIELITGEDGEKLDTDTDISLSPKELGKKLMGLKFLPFETELVEGVRDLLEIKCFLEQKRKALPGLIFRLRGYTEIEEALINQAQSLESKLGRFTNSLVEQMWKGLGTAMEGELIHDLGNYLAPTKSQLEVFSELRRIVSDQEIRAFISRQNYDLFANNLLPRAQRRRLDFKRLCEERNRALVSHLSIPSLVKTSLQEGVLQSSFKQSQSGKIPVVNSPAGEQKILSQLTFAIDGAALGYGGLDKKAVQMERNFEEVVSFSNMTGAVEFAQSVGFVVPYSSIVNGRKFVEHPATGRGNLRDELHIFDPQHSDENRVGAQISVDDMFLFVPEKGKQEWEDFLLKSKDQGGAGKNQDWVQTHMKDYPEYVDLDIYLRYFVDKDSLGVISVPFGIFITNGKKMTIHRGLKKQKPFVWRA